ncbi:hypothetical protein MN116_000846 [Schistosoma mekongi]|uniref:RRM domain-containing protein n=1 Tax=Schistosoma mekongi TaxID=38744 RepID=A0AAE2D8L5_SCHME|nr:hypothetical protein MN116_000846 [Schistosoma mekongi]
MEIINSNDLNSLNQIKKSKHDYQHLPNDNASTTMNYYTQFHDNQSINNNFQQIDYPFCTLSTTMTSSSPSPSSSSGSSASSASSASSLLTSTSFIRSSPSHNLLSQSMNDKRNEPDCLVIFNICTSGRQYEETGSDEYPIMLLTAKIYHLKQIDEDGAEFQQFIKPCQMIFHDTKESNLSKIKQSHIKLTNDEVYPQEDDDSTTSDITIQSYFNEEECNMKIIEPTEECVKVTSVNSHILREAPSLETALKHFNHWLQVNNLYSFKSDRSTMNTKYPENPCQDQFDSLTSIQSCSTATTDITVVDNINEKMECDENRKSFILLVDGPYGIRLTLHPETTTKSIDLTMYPYFYQFIDIKKSFTKFYQLNTIPKTLNEMIKYLQIDSEYSPPYSNIQLEEILFQQSENEKINKQYDYELCNSKMQSSEGTVNLLQNHLNYTTVQESYELDHVNEQFNFTLNELHNQPGYWPIQHCKIIVKIVQKMTLDGMEWTEFETVNREYYPAIISKSDIVSDNVVVRARGLPWQATDLEIFQFFSGINIAKGGISLVLSKIGRRNGEALIQFVDEEQQCLALRKHKHHVGKRYIEVYAATGQDFVSVAGGETQEAIDFLEKLTTPTQTLIRMRGLPYTTTPEQIITFFANTNCSVQFGVDGILFVNKRDGRATGDAFVIFETKAIAEKALENNKQHIGNRYIELFKSTPAEVNQVMNSILNPICEEQIHCWNNLTECTTNNSSIFTINNNITMPPFNETNHLLYPNYNLKLLSNQSIIPDITYPPHIFSMLNSNPLFINDSQQLVNTQQQTLSYGLTTNLSQNANLCLQRILPNTNTINTSMTNILPTDHLNTFISLDMLNNFIGVMNNTSSSSSSSPNQLITTDFTRPIGTMHSLSNFGSTLVLPRFPVNSIPSTMNSTNYNVNSSNNTSDNSSNSCSNVSMNTTPITNNINNKQFIIPDFTNLQLLHIFGPNLLMASTTTSHNNSNTTTVNTTKNINSNNSKNNENLLNLHLSIEQIAKTFIRICGMPINADITDILIFLQDNWRNVAVHGIHLVYDVTGQPIGEAMIQFITELSAQNVCEQKHKSIFIKYGLPFPFGVYVDVIQCTTEDLNQLLSNMSKNIETFTNFISSSTSSASTVAAMNPLTLTQLNGFDESKSIHGVYHDSIPKSSIPFHSGYSITQPNVVQLKNIAFNLSPYISSRELNNFNIPPPTFPNVSDYIPGINNAFPLSIPFIENITNGFQIPNFIYPTSMPNIFSSHESSRFLSTSMPYITNYPTDNNILIDNNNKNKNNVNDIKTNSWVNHNNKNNDIMNKPELQLYKSNNLIGSKLDNKLIMVTINGLPKDMNSIDFNQWLEKKIKNLNILSIQFENSLNEISNGSVKLYLQHYSDAELIVQEFNNTNLNNFRISAKIN